MLRGPPFAPADHVQGGRNMTAEISGRDRFMFFKRPVVPSMEDGTQTTGSTMYNVTRPGVHRPLVAKTQTLQTGEVAQLTQSKPKHRIVEKGEHNVGFEAVTKPAKLPGIASSHETPQPPTNARDFGTQSDFRESDCQTDPYTPAYYYEAKEGEEPEVLAIQVLRFGEGLPAGLAEVEMIDRVQRRKKVEAELPQGNDPKSMQLRLESLEALEKVEWEEREQHIKTLQEKRLDEIKHALARREEQREQMSRDRVDAVKRQKLEEVENRLRFLQEKRLTATRKLTTKHRNPCCEKETRDIIEAHLSYGYRAKPISNNSLIDKIATANYDVRPTLLGFVEGVQELERTKVPKLETVKASHFEPPEEAAIKNLATNYQKRQARQVVEHLEHANSIIEKSHQPATKAQSIQDLYRATPRLQRPDTPTLILQGDEEEEREEAMLLLQRLLRGRAVQNDFFEGKERCKGLIEELQAAQNTINTEHLWKPEQERESMEERQEQMVDSVIDGMTGDVIFGTLDYLFKELTRQQQMAQIDRLRNHAEEERERREANERLQRQAEETLRAKEEAQYARVLQSVDYTVETFLEQITRTTVNSIAHEQAIGEEASRAPTYAEPTDAVACEEFVCDLLDKFIIPQVCRNTHAAENRNRKAIAEVATGSTGVLLQI